MSEDKDNEQDKRDQIFTDGERAALIGVLGHCIRHLTGMETRTREQLLYEREGAIQALRTICEAHGDNDWPADLHLADIINKHLARHLDNE